MEVGGAPWPSSYEDVVGHFSKQGDEVPEVEELQAEVEVDPQTVLVVPHQAARVRHIERGPVAYRKGNFRSRIKKPARLNTSQDQTLRLVDTWSAT